MSTIAHETRNATTAPASEPQASPRSEPPRAKKARPSGRWVQHRNGEWVARMISGGPFMSLGGGIGPDDREGAEARARQLRELCRTRDVDALCVARLDHRSVAQGWIDNALGGRWQFDNELRFLADLLGREDIRLFAEIVDELRFAVWAEREPRRDLLHAMIRAGLALAEGSSRIRVEAIVRSINRLLPSEKPPSPSNVIPFAVVRARTRNRTPVSPQGEGG